MPPPPVTLTFDLISNAIISMFVTYKIITVPYMLDNNPPPAGTGRAFGLVVTVCKPALFCCLTQGLQGGLGMKGEKGIPGFPGPRVSVRNISVNFSLHSA